MKRATLGAGRRVVPRDDPSAAVARARSVAARRRDALRPRDAGHRAPAPSRRSTCTASAARRTNWTDLAGLLADRLDGQAIDLPGFGHSDPAARYTIAAFADRVARWIEYADRGPVHLFGNSLGGAIAVRVAGCAPTWCASLTLISPAMPFLDPRRSLQGRVLPLLALPRAERHRRPAAGPDRAGGDGPPGDRRLLRRPGAGQRAAAGRGDRGGPAALHAGPLSDGLPAHAARPGAVSFLRAYLPGPTRCGGSPGGSPRRRWSSAAGSDRLVDVRVAPQVAGTIPDSRLLMLDGVGHVAQMEVPRIVARAVLGTARRGGRQRDRRLGMARSAIMTGPRSRPSPRAGDGPPCTRAGPSRGPDRAAARRRRRLRQRLWAIALGMVLAVPLRGGRGWAAARPVRRRPPPRPGPRRARSGTIPHRPRPPGRQLTSGPPARHRPPRRPGGCCGCPATVPDAGSGTFDVHTAGRAGRSGTSGTLRRFRVAVEQGAPEDARRRSPRWSTRRWATRGAGSPAGGCGCSGWPTARAHDFTVYLATRETAGRMCAAGGVNIRVGGEPYTSCRASGQGDHQPGPLAAVGARLRRREGAAGDLPAVRDQPRGRARAGARPRALSGRGPAGAGDAAADARPRRVRRQPVAVPWTAAGTPAGPA